MAKCESGSCSGGKLLHDMAKEAKDEATKNTLQSIKHKIIVMSGKGGVGKTSVSVNLAMALAQNGHRVGIMDVDIHGPDVPRMLGFKGLLDVNEERKLIPMAYSANLCAVSIESLQQNKDDAIIWRGPLKNSIIRQFIADVAWGDLDYLIIDSPPGTGDEPLSVANMITDAKAVIVTTPQEIALADVRKSINFCKTVKMDIIGIVENMSGFSCPHCHETISLFGEGGGKRTADMTGIPFLGKIPFDLNMVVCSDAGDCFQELHTDSPVTQAFESLAQKIHTAMPV